MKVIAFNFVNNFSFMIQRQDGGGYDDRNENMEGSDESGDEGKQHDPYLYRMKQEAANRNGEDVGEGSDESTDEDFAPGENEEDVSCW